MTGEVKVERRITYSYGVNRDQTRTGFASFEWLQSRVEQETMGRVHVTKKEQRIVTYGEWTVTPEGEEPLLAIDGKPVCRCPGDDPDQRESIGHEAYCPRATPESDAPPVVASGS